MKGIGTDGRPPILDLLVPIPLKAEEKPFKWWEPLLIVLAVFTATFIIYWLVPIPKLMAVVSALCDKLGSTLVSSLMLLVASGYDVFFIAVPLAVVAAIALHELGHVFAGYAVGCKFRSLSVGPVFFENYEGRLRIRVRTFKAIGLTVMDRKQPNATSWKEGMFFAAGPAVNLFTWLLLNSYLPPANTLIAPPHHLMVIGMKLLAAFSLYFCIAPLVPVKGKTTASDGARLWSLLFYHRKTKRLLALQNLKVEMDSGKGIRDLNENWIKAAVAIYDESHEALLASLLAYGKFMDRNDYSVAAIHLERLLAIGHLSRRIADLAAFEAAFFQAWVKKDVEKAEVWYIRVKDSEKPPPRSHQRVSIAINAAKGLYEAALTEWEQAMPTFEDVPEPKRTRYLQDWQEWKVEIQERAKATVHAASASSSS